MPASRHEVPDLPLVPEGGARPGRPTGDSSPVAQVFGENGGVLHVCTALGHNRN